MHKVTDIIIIYSKLNAPQKRKKKYNKYFRSVATDYFIQVRFFVLHFSSVCEQYGSAKIKMHFIEAVLYTR